MTFQERLQSDKIYTVADLDYLYNRYCSKVKTSNKQKINYYNVPLAFDIETTSFYIHDDGSCIDYETMKKYAEEDPDGWYDPPKRACMYVWQFGINGCVIVGRTWDEFTQLCDRLIELFSTDDTHRIIIYVHNLAYEFQWIRKLFHWENVFSMSVRKPIYAVTDTGIEFRCSYIMSGYGLQKLGDQLQTYKVQKMVGDLDYSKLRHSGTQLTAKELGYCVNDVKVVMAYIREQMEQRRKQIARLPLTNTGRVREYCRQQCFYDPDGTIKNSRKRLRYKELINSMTLDPDEYRQLKDAFQGGFTHANGFCVPFKYNGKMYDKIFHDVTSVDFTSSYPYVMISEQFPMSTGELYKPEDTDDFLKQLRLYCCLFTLEIWDLESVVTQDHYLAVYRCRNLDGASVDNGRVASAKYLYTIVTEQDFLIITRVYTYSKIKISRFRRYKKSYLPTDFVKSILQLYKDKTVLKGVEGKEIEYLNSKGMLNSTYGMAVTDIVREVIEYTDDWHTHRPDVIDVINKYNKSPGRFLFYPWGVWVTAYARRNLWTGILEFGEDYIYSDTDSLKVMNIEQHQTYITNYNDNCALKLKKACEWHGIPFEDTCPKTIKGVPKPLGVWDWDGHYQKFKTLGAKRYLVQYSDDPRNGSSAGEVNMTVAGLNKKVTVPYMMDQCDNDVDKVFAMFNDEMKIPAGHTGKNTHVYLDSEYSGYMTDYTGIRGLYHERSSIHMEPAEYDLSLKQEYINYILGINEEAAQ